MEERRLKGELENEAVAKRQLLRSIQDTQFEVRSARSEDCSAR